MYTVHVHIKVTFNATEARAKFFQLLKLVERGVDVTIERKDTNIKFHIRKEEITSGKKLIVQQMSHSGLRSKSPEAIKRILENISDINE